VENGDLIAIDIPQARLDLRVDPEELARRKAAWSRPEPKVKKGYLSIYAKMADSTARGASLKYR
jgi:dihydroxy-acid dehydratase